MAVIVAGLIAIIAGGAYVLANQSNANLPAYLGACVSGAGGAYHAHAHVAITVNGSPRPLPPDLGRTGGCFRPLHTHTNDNVVHIEPDQEHLFTLADLFLVWGQTLNATDFMGHSYTAGQLNMTVGATHYSSTTSTPIWDYAFPRNAQYNTETCSATPCQQVDIAITLNTPGA